MLCEINRLNLLDWASGRITQILNGKRGIPAEAALRLARYFGNTRYRCQSCRRGANGGSVKVSLSQDRGGGFKVAQNHGKDSIWLKQGNAVICGLE